MKVQSQAKERRCRTSPITPPGRRRAGAAVCTVSTAVYTVMFGLPTDLAVLWVIPQRKAVSCPKAVCLFSQTPPSLAVLHARKERTRDELVQLPEVRGVAEDVADLPVNATFIISLHHGKI